MRKSRNWKIEVRKTPRAHTQSRRVGHPVKKKCELERKTDSPRTSRSEVQRSSLRSE